MAFATVIHLEMNLEGNRKIVCGQTTSDSTDGNIETGLSLVESLLFTHKGSGEEAATAVVNADLPLASGDVAIHCVSGDVVYFMAIGQ
jgi:hypothetical protein|tara:strand:+ start:742 stop:1005 length:264 start_codon:yes stop_codon:yes gene_type:complete